MRLCIKRGTSPCFKILWSVEAGGLVYTWGLMDFVAVAVSVFLRQLCSPELYTPDWPGALQLDKLGFEAVLIFLPGCWDYKCAPPCGAFKYLPMCTRSLDESSVLGENKQLLGVVFTAWEPMDRKWKIKFLTALDHKANYTHTREDISYTDTQ